MTVEELKVRRSEMWESFKRSRTHENRIYYEPTRHYVVGVGGPKVLNRAGWMLYNMFVGADLAWKQAIWEKENA